MLTMRQGNTCTTLHTNVAPETLVNHMKTSGSTVSGRTQFSTEYKSHFEMMEQAADVADFSKKFTEQRAHRSAKPEEHWRRAFEQTILVIGIITSVTICRCNSHKRQAVFFKVQLRRYYIIAVLVARAYLMSTLPCQKI
jgi:hypothetical protein